MKKLMCLISLFTLMMSVSIVKAEPYAATLASAKSQEVTITSIPNNAKVYGEVQIDCPVLADSYTAVTLDGTILASSEKKIDFFWQPQKLGNNKLVYNSGDTSLTTTVNVVEFEYYVQASPNPPTSADKAVSITPLSRSFEVGGGAGAIVTAGSGTWSASVSDSWLSLNTTSGNVGYPVAYTVSMNTNVEARVGYVYVNGHTHTVNQAGLGATVDVTSKSFECTGGEGVVNVVAQNKIKWEARPNVDWISVSPTYNYGESSITYEVAPFYEVSTRQGTMTIAGNTVTIFQYGLRMLLETEYEERDWYTHVIPIKVNALSITSWNVKPNASWISVVDAGNGKGGDTVSIAIAENPSYKARTGTVTIGTETFTVKQSGRTDLVFNLSPTETTASVNGANGLIAVTATPDLPWEAKSEANWLTIFSTTGSGAGNGNVVYSASPNSTLYSRSGTITVTPDANSSMPVRTHKVTQPAATSAISQNSYEFEASGESFTLDVSVADVVEWKIEESLDWLTVNGSTSRVGPGKVTLQASANETVYKRSGKVTIARKTFTVTQKARGVQVEYDTKLFGTDGGSEGISIHPDGDVSWTAVSSDETWITIYGGGSGKGDGEILYIVSPYVGDGSSRTGTITVGDKVIYITQRAYDLSINPTGTKVKGNNGAGEFGVSASIGDVWNAIVTEPWITIVTGYDSGTGSGTVRFAYTDNNTGKVRTGKIIVSGEVYTIEQAARTMVNISATAESGGSVSGGGSYDLGSDVTLTAIPNDGYKFSYWTGDIETMQNPITIVADKAKSVTAIFEPLPIVFKSVTSSTEGVALAWNNLAWATTYRIYRGESSVPSSAKVLVELQNTGSCEYFDETGTVDTEYWYWIEAEGTNASVMSDPMTGKKEKPAVYSSVKYTNLRGATHSNPDTYREGTLVSFTNPSSVVGYTFAGWTPSQITSDMTGAQTITANWSANTYSITYNPNGGSGEMASTSATYDKEAIISQNSFVYAGYVFKGWAIEANGVVAYNPGQAVTNLTAISNGVVPLYAVWEKLVVSAPVVIPEDGSEFIGETCEVTISCPLEGAKIYYSPKGATPRISDSYLYTGPFTITDTSTIKAVAVVDGVKSEYTTAVITKRALTLAEAAGAPELVFATGGDAEWTPIVDETTQNGFSVKSGVISLEEASWLETSVTGAGTFSFKWMVDCEWDDSYACGWDYVVVSVNGVEKERMDGTTDWEEMELEFTDSGTHTIRWTFHKDDYDEEYANYEDCAWLSDVSWVATEIIDPIPELPSTATTKDVANALAGSVDKKLIENITSVDEYNSYRKWATSLSSTTTEQVKNSPNAWLSYALATTSLIAREPQEGELAITSFAPASIGDGFNLVFALDNIKVGSGATPENLAKVFTVEGSDTLNSSSFSSGNVAMEFSTPSRGKVNAVVKPKDTDARSFFIRVILEK